MNFKPLLMFILALWIIVDAQFEVVIKNPTPTLTDSYCVAHPHTLRFKADKKSIKEVQSNAFSKCTAVTTIILNSNQIIRLVRDVFINNNKLEVLQLGENLIEQIDDDLFTALFNLKILGLGSNRIRYFPPGSVRNLNNLQHLYLQGNELLDIDERSLLGYLPILRTLGINNNDIPCKRVEQILKALKSRGVAKETASGRKRNRNYSIKKYDDIDCIDGLNGRIIESLGTIKQQFNDHFLSKTEIINVQFQGLRSELLNLTQSSKSEIKLLTDAFQRTAKITMQQLGDFLNEIKKDVESLKAMNAEFRNDLRTIKDSDKKLGEIQKILQLEMDDVKLTTKKRALALSNFCNSI